MPTRIIDIVMDCAEMRSTAQFWSGLLGWPITFEDQQELRVKGEHLGIVFGQVPEPKTGKNRVHLDLASADLLQQRETVDRALMLGARHIDVGQGDAEFVVLADPEGNEFCVLDPRSAYTDTGAAAALVQDCHDPMALGPFWSAATGRPIETQNEEYVSMRLADGRGPWLELIRRPDAKLAKHRVHIDIAPFAADDQVAEVERLIALGARRIDIGQGDVPWVVLADPEGNEFCVLTARGTRVG